MNSADWKDRLVDGALREILGGETPPDLAGRILGNAFSQKKKPRVSRVAWAAGIAAAIVAVVCVFAFWPRYPALRARGDYNVAGGGRPQRGSVIETQEGSAELTLGGYAAVSLSPNTALRIEGGPFAEAVYLQQGDILCEVSRERGTFKVNSDIGVVSVSGTEFKVSILEEEGGTDMPAKRMLVKVMAGAVLVAGSWGQRALYAGDEATLPEAPKPIVLGERAAQEEGLPDGLKGFSGQVRGVVTAKGDGNTFQFKVGRLIQTWKGSKAENPELIVGRTVPVGPRWVKGENGKWRPVELHVAFIRKLVVGQELTLEIRHAEREHFAILELNNDQRALAKGSTETGDSPERERNAQIEKLQKQIKDLKAENAELRRMLESRR